MTPEPESLEQTYADQLTDFESQLRHTMDDQSLLQDVFRAIRELLKDHRESETDIRKILHERFQSGHLREETFQVVQRMLDNIVNDFVSTFPGAESGAGADFGETDVLPENVLSEQPGTERLQSGSVLRDRFLLQEQISGGSMGLVYKALDRRLAEVDEADPWVAIKVLTPKLSRNVNALRAMQQEAAKGRCLAHPNIVRFIDLDRDDELYFIVMEWIEGRSLAAVLDDPNCDPIDLQTSLEIVRQVGRALDYAHGCGVVHADVKPGNLMIMPDGTVKLIDFGVARIRQQEMKGNSSFDPGVLGAATPAYSSMQVLTGEDPVPADDVFSLGCLLYRLIAGHRVFGPRNAAEAAEEGMVPQRPSGITDNQWRALKKALAFSRVARYTSPKAFVSDLFGVDGARPVSNPEETELDVIEAPASGRWRALAGLAVLTAVAGYFGWQQGYLDRWLDRSGGMLPVAVAPDIEPATVSNEPSVPEPAADSFAPSAESSGVRETGEPIPDEDMSVSPSESATEMVDLSLDQVFVDDAEMAKYAGMDGPESVPEPLPQPTHVVRLATAGGAPENLTVVLREDGADALIELQRRSNLGIPLVVRLEEIGFSGNRSPWETGQYSMARDGIARFAAGESRAQIRLAMMSDPLREADRQVDLVVREAESPDRDLARVSLTLEDDDQRRFESSLPPNTIAFATSQVAVAEADPAVQIDVLRFNPDEWPAEVDYIVQDVTASEGADYFAPRVKTVSFAPGQRNARILIPLVQDSALESDEAFFLEIVSTTIDAEANIFRRVAVMIRDDDSRP